MKVSKYTSLQTIGFLSAHANDTLDKLYTDINKLPVLADVLCRSLYIDDLVLINKRHIYVSCN